MRSASWTLSLVLVARCLAWGGEGHRIVGTIASSDLTPTAAAAMRELLGNETLADACCWADDVRSDRGYDWIKPLHYINVPQGATAVDMSRDGAKGEQVVGAIERFRKVLADPSQPKEKRLEALRLVLHLVGDVHQPLHVSYSVDLGGNRLSVVSFGAKSNMHRVWDTDLIRRKLKDTKGGWATLSADLRQAITDRQRETWRAAAEPRAWADESLAITRRIYREPPDAKEGVNDAYWRAWMPVVNERLQMAGVRLAMVLNSALDRKPESKAPPAPRKP